MESVQDNVGKLRQSVVMFLTLMLFWVMLMSSLSTDVLVVGVVASFLITLLYQDGFSFFTEFRMTPAAFLAGIKYYAYFFKELIKSNLGLSYIVLNPKLPINPGIIKVRTGLKSRMGRLMLANSITLTPGTLSVELQDEWIYVHWVTVETDEIESATEQIVAGFEAYLEVMYG